jgi:hypothetical protein
MHAALSGEDECQYDGEWFHRSLATPAEEIAFGEYLDHQVE